MPPEEEAATGPSLAISSGEEWEWEVEEWEEEVGGLVWGGAGMLVGG